jgi:hypothetical protein
MKFFMFIMLSVFLNNVVNAATVDLTDTVNEEQCLELAVTDEDVDQCMDQAY